MRHSNLIPIIVWSIVILLLSSALSFASETEMDSPLPVLTSSESGTDAVLVIDVSGSMKQSDPEYLCKDAARRFLETLSLTPGSRAALITFSDTLQTVLPLCSLDSDPDRSSLFDELNHFTYTSGDTDIGTALEKAASLLTEEDSHRPKSIFLLTDGEIDLPAAENEEMAEKESLTRALLAVEEAKTQGITIHTISLDLTGGMDEHLMNYVADSTGGTANRIRDAAALEPLFEALSSFAASAQTKAEQPDQEQDPAKDADQAETETESETETEQYIPPVIQTIGTIDGPVHLKGVFPNLCQASLDLSDLFRAEGSEPGIADSLLFTAWCDDSTMLACSVEGNLLKLSGRRNGTVQIHVIAELASTDAAAGNNPNPFQQDSWQGEAENAAASPLSQAEITFTAEVDALLPSLWVLSILPVFALLIAATVLIVRKRKNSCIPLSGSLQWYVRGENEKIFGMPAQTMADLGDYGNKVRLSELVQDELLDGSPLHKVTICGTPGGIAIESRSASCLIAAEGRPVQRRMILTHSIRFKVLCETGNGTACVIACYSADRPCKTEPSYEDDSDERTRLLV